MLCSDNKLDKKSKIVYASIIAICIISIIIVIYIQFFDGKTVTTVGYLKGKRRKAKLTNQKAQCSSKR